MHVNRDWLCKFDQIGCRMECLEGAETVTAKPSITVPRAIVVYYRDSEENKIESIMIQ